MKQGILEVRMSHHRHTAKRTCIGCKETRQIEELIRLVLAPDGQIAVDIDRRLPGRGAHICPSISCMEMAVRGNAFTRAFRQTISPPTADSLADMLCERLEEKLSGLIGIGHKARQVLSGSMALEKGLQRNRVHLLLLATDIGVQQRAKWLDLYRSSGRPWATYYTKDRLGSLLGKELRSAVGFVSPKMAQTATRLVSLLCSVRGEERG